MTTRSLDRKRAARAVTESMEIVPTDTMACHSAARQQCAASKSRHRWRFTVRTEHGVYTVDAQARTCTCQDFRNRIAKLRRAGNRDAMCKHLLRVVNGTHLLQAQLVVGTKERDEWKEAV